MTVIIRKAPTGTVSTSDGSGSPGSTVGPGGTIISSEVQVIQALNDILHELKRHTLGWQEAVEKELDIPEEHIPH